MSQDKAIFNVKSEKLKGYAQFVFIEGSLTELKMNFKEPLNTVQKELFKLNFPFQVQELDQFRKLGFKVVEKNLKKQVDNGLKVALWSKYYGKYVKKKAKGANEAPKSYRIMPKEIGMLSHVEVTEEMLQAYFECEEWWCKTKSVGNYVSRINEIELLLSTAGSSTTKHPNKWDRDYFNMLDSAEHADYYRHLRLMGYTPVKAKTGHIIDWK